MSDRFMRWWEGLPEDRQNYYMGAALGAVFVGAVVLLIVGARR